MKITERNRKCREGVPVGFFFSALVQTLESAQTELHPEHSLKMPDFGF